MMLIPEEADALMPKGASLFFREGGHGDGLTGVGFGVESFGGGPRGSESLSSSKGATLAGHFFLLEMDGETFNRENKAAPPPLGLSWLLEGPFLAPKEESSISGKRGSSSEDDEHRRGVVERTRVVMETTSFGCTMSEEAAMGPAIQGCTIAWPEIIRCFLPS